MGEKEIRKGDAFKVITALAGHSQVSNFLLLLKKYCPFLTPHPLSKRQVSLSINKLERLVRDKHSSLL
jgi:hypothetical protein